MNIAALKEQILLKKSFLCVGLDIDLDKVPDYIKEMEDPLFEFSKSIIDGSERLMYVVGATKASALKNIRTRIPNSFLLIPGVGAQGGSLTEVAENGISDDVGILVNSSRGIIYASQGQDFDEAAAKAAHDLQLQMQTILENKGFL